MYSFIKFFIFITTNYYINQQKINNFNIIEDNCFNYRKGSFVLALMNSIPIIQTICYSPMPDNNYNYFNNEYKIKHINHIGVKILKAYYYKSNSELTDSYIENYRKKLESIFKKQYIKTLLSAHKFNITND